MSTYVSSYNERHGQSKTRTEDRHAPPAIALVRDLGPPPPELVVEGGFEDVLVPLVLGIDELGLVLCDEVVVVSERVGGLVGVASGSLPACRASTGSNPGSCK